MMLSPITNFSLFLPGNKNNAEETDGPEFLLQTPRDWSCFSINIKAISCVVQWTEKPTNDRSFTPCKDAQLKKIIALPLPEILFMLRLTS